jgi:hypothetical protein
MRQFRSKAEKAFLYERIRQSIKKEPQPINMICERYRVHRDVVRRIAKEENIVLPRNKETV